MLTSDKAPQSTRILFARVGWMTYYAGSQDGDERPAGGGRYNKKNIGHELFNFAQFGSRLYGYAAASINLKRIDPIAKGAEKIDNVLVIFMAGQHIIGWYRDAIVYASDGPQFPPAVAKEMLRRLKQSDVRGFGLIGYRFEAAVENATLLPTYERKHKIPRNVKGGFGQSNARYPYTNSGKSNNTPWMKKAVEYILNYDKANLLTSPDAEASSEEAATAAKEQSAGFRSDPQIREAIEEHAMKEAQKALQKRGFSRFDNTSATKPFDFVCWRDGKRFFIEVKGTQTPGKTLILTKNEVGHVKSNPDSCVLVVVHSVKITAKKAATAGTPVVTEKWDLTQGKLIALQYLWKI